MRAIKRSFALTFLAVLGGAQASAQGITDFVINPNTGHTISTRGSYRLAADFTMLEDVTAITISVPEVKIDLNGHSITGFGPGDGTKAGINVGIYDQCSVKNGSLSNFGDAGIASLGVGCAVTEVSVSGCGQGGISAVGATARVSHCSARGNNGAGISVGQGGIIELSSAINNNALGIQAGPGSIIRSCIAKANFSTTVDGSGIGISGGTGCVITDCVAIGNNGLGSGTAAGISASSYCVVSGCTASENVAGETGIFAYGIDAGSACKIVGNTCAANYEGENANGTAFGIVTASGSLIENNVCRENSALGSNGSARGISPGPECVVRGNVVSNNNGVSGSGYGIHVTNSRCTIEGNSCTDHLGNAAGWGIFVSTTNLLVRGNSTNGNETGGIRLAIAGSGANTVRAERNRIGEPAGFSDAGSNSIGTGEDANIVY